MTGVCGKSIKICPLPPSGISPVYRRPADGLRGLAFCGIFRKLGIRRRMSPFFISIPVFYGGTLSALCNSGAVKVATARSFGSRVNRDFGLSSASSVISNTNFFRTALSNSAAPRIRSGLTLSGTGAGQDRSKSNSAVFGW